MRNRYYKIAEKFHVRTSRSTLCTTRGLIGLWDMSNPTQYVEIFLRHFLLRGPRLTACITEMELILKRALPRQHNSNPHCEKALNSAGNSVIVSSLCNAV